MKKLTFYILSFIAIILATCATMTFPKAMPADSSSQNLEVTFIDVGQGDSTLIKTPSGETILIDGGEYDSFQTHLMPFLLNEDIQNIDIAIATHYHSDHMGGIYSLVERNGARHLILPDYPDSDNSRKSLEKIASKTNTSINYASAGDSIRTHCENLSIKFLNPPEGGLMGDNFHNNSSLVLMVSYYGTSFLITGDIESRAEQEILRRTAVECDVLKAPHHGSSTSSSKSFLRATNPTYAIISAGEDNPYGHPHYEVLSALEDEDVQVFRTDRDGNITFTVAKNSIQNITFSKN